jgi:hypothetical protein
LQDVGDRAGVAEIIGGIVTLAIRGDFGLVYGRVARARAGAGWDVLDSEPPKRPRPRDPDG